MKANTMLSAALKGLGLTKADAAKAIGWTPQQLNGRLSRNSLRADEFIDLLDGVGIELQLVSKQTGKVFKTRIKGAGRRVRAMVGRVTYDTGKSDALSNNFYSDGVNMYNDGTARELYIDSEGRYFFAEYYEWAGTKDRITPVNAEDAAAFISKYGTTIFKEPDCDSETNEHEEIGEE